MIQPTQYKIAPELETIKWINSPAPLSLEQLRGKVVVIHAFQMLCPGCVSHGLPQANEIYQTFDNDKIQVIGLHTVFEHHNVMNEDALRAFVSEYRIDYPVAIDKPSRAHPIPSTMGIYQMKGTPTLIVIDQQGRLRLNHFGTISNMKLGSLIGGLLAEETNPSVEVIEAPSSAIKGTCDEEGCTI